MSEWSGKRVLITGVCGTVGGEALRQVLEELLEDLLLAQVAQVLEHLEAFALVLEQRVALSVSPQPDAATQVVHRLEVLLPEVVEHAK